MPQHFRESILSIAGSPSCTSSLMETDQKKVIRLILGDQLHSGHSWFDRVDPTVLYVMMEIRPESEYVTHHIQKIVGIFSAMRAFASHLTNAGHAVRYFRISDADNKHSFRENLRQIIDQYPIVAIHYMEPDEWRLDRLLETAMAGTGLEYQMVGSEHFYTSRSELENFFHGKKQLVMESFYRQMRRKHNVLMDGDTPATGTWNYDKLNRNRLPQGIDVPRPYLLQHDVTLLLDEIEAAGLKYIGNIDPRNFIWPVTRQEALALADHFVDNLLSSFGTFQDALSDKGWSLYHSRLSFGLNLKLITPQEIVHKVESAWRNKPEEVDIAQAEGFIRQILGWREFMRGIYWMHMPGFRDLNFFNASLKLPEYFWSGETDLLCVSHAIGQSLNHSYAHHIQRLMVTGNFCALLGIDPAEVDEWYLGIYIDAFEWVELTNTRGMSQFADGGIVGTKPYVSSASYINKMSDYCSRCHYDPKKRHGANACPFNSLYWHFLARNEKLLRNNPRMSMMYRVWDKFDAVEQSSILGQAEKYIENRENL